MARVFLVKDTVKDLEFELAKHKAVQSQFPDAKFRHYVGFQSKQVNQNYTKFEFERRPRGLFVLPYYEVDFTFNGKTEIVKVYAAPRASRLIYLKWNVALKNYVMKFSRFAINLKNNNFRGDIVNDCRTEVMSFIKNNPSYKLDDRHLEPRLKKLLVFT